MCDVRRCQRPPSIHYVINGIWKGMCNECNEKYLDDRMPPLAAQDIWRD